MADLEKIFFVQAGYKDSYFLPNSSWPSKAIDSVETRLGNDKGQHVAIRVLGMNPWGGKKKMFNPEGSKQKGVFARHVVSVSLLFQILTPRLQMRVGRWLYPVMLPFANRFLNDANLLNLSSARTHIQISSLGKKGPRADFKNNLDEQVNIFFHALFFCIY